MQKSIPSLFTSKAPKLLCPKHPAKTIHSLCLHQGCLAPYICAQCKEEHPKDHLKAFQSINSVYNDKRLASYSKALHSDFSSENIEFKKDKMFVTIRTIEEKFRKIILEMMQMIENSFDYLKKEVERRKNATNAFNQIKNIIQSNANNKYLIELAQSYRIAKQDCNERLDVDLENYFSAFQEEMISIHTEIRNELLSASKISIVFETPDFSKLEVQERFHIPISSGVIYESTVYIPKWNVLAFGCRDNLMHSVGFYHLEDKKILTSVRGVHRDWITTVVWMENKNYLLTASLDSTIKVFKVSNHGNTLKVICILRGHTLPVRCLRYLENENLLVSAGLDANIRLWSMRGFRRYGTIPTNTQGEMDGSIAYIEADKLIGLAFRAGFIRFYDIQKRSLAFQLDIGYGISRAYGLQYLPQRRMIITNVCSRRQIKTWQYVEGEKRAVSDAGIHIEESGYRILASGDESQFLSLQFKPRRQKLEMYNIDSHQKVLYDLPDEITNSCCLLSLGTKGVLVANYGSGDMCILSTR